MKNPYTLNWPLISFLIILSIVKFDCSSLEIAKQKGWTNLWIECDSTLIIQSFKNPFYSSLEFTHTLEKLLFFFLRYSFDFFLTFIGKKTLSADKLANFGALSRITLFGGILSCFFVGDEYLKNKNGLPNPPVLLWVLV